MSAASSEGSARCGGGGGGRVPIAAVAKWALELEALVAVEAFLLLRLTPPPTSDSTTILQEKKKGEGGEAAVEAPEKSVLHSSGSGGDPGLDFLVRRRKQWRASLSKPRTALGVSEVSDAVKELREALVAAGAGAGAGAASLNSHPPAASDAIGAAWEALTAFDGRGSDGGSLYSAVLATTLKKGGDAKTKSSAEEGKAGGAGSGGVSSEDASNPLINVFGGEEDRAAAEAEAEAASLSPAPVNGTSGAGHGEGVPSSSFSQKEEGSSLGPFALTLLQHTLARKLTGKRPEPLVGAGGNRHLRKGPGRTSSSSAPSSEDESSRSLSAGDFTKRAKEVAEWAVCPMDCGLAALADGLVDTVALLEGEPLGRIRSLEFLEGDLALLERM